MRGKNTYFILRELHSNETDKLVRLACENVIDILIKKEEEINLVSMLKKLFIGRVLRADVFVCNIFLG